MDLLRAFDFYTSNTWKAKVRVELLNGNSDRCAEREGGFQMRLINTNPSNQNYASYREIRS